MEASLWTDYLIIVNNVELVNPVNIYMFKVNNKNKKTCKTCSILIIKTAERSQYRQLLQSFPFRCLREFWQRLCCSRKGYRPEIGETLPILTVSSKISVKFNGSNTWNICYLSIQTWMELLPKIFNGWKVLTFFARAPSYMLDGALSALLLGILGILLV